MLWFALGAWVSAGLGVAFYLQGNVLPIWEDRAKGNPFFIEVELSLIQDRKTLDRAALWLLRRFEGEEVISPVNVIMFLRLVNLQERPTTIHRVSVQMQLGDRPWTSLTRMNPQYGQMFWSVEGFNRTRRIDFSSTGLDYLLYERVMQPNESARGWLFFEIPNDYLAPKGTPVRYKIKVRDNAGLEFE